jgi:hypothetical protein
MGSASRSSAVCRIRVAVRSWTSRGDSGVRSGSVARGDCGRGTASTIGRFGWCRDDAIAVPPDPGATDAAAGVAFGVIVNAETGEVNDE